MEFEFELSGAKEGARRVQRMRQRMDKVSVQAIHDQFEMITAFLEGEVKQRMPTDTGILRSSIFGEVNVTGMAVEGLVSTPLIYGSPVEEGRRPGAKQPPSAALKQWAQRKLGDERLAFVVARSIAKKGIEGKHMFRDAWQQNTNKVKQLLDEIGVHVSEELLRQL